MQRARVVYTSHLELRLKARRIPREYPRLVLEEPDQKFFDTVERTLIAIKRLEYNSKMRQMMIAYNKNDTVEIITIHPIREEQMINRIANKRWTKNE